MDIISIAFSRIVGEYSPPATPPIAAPTTAPVAPRLAVPDTPQSVGRRLFENSDTEYFYDL